ncbi:hypothetical protein CASFOL_033583 [Castilleja foliolosa]|uniref:SWIM-type domain-containing protein n=1 Tax=Castilleja foliolosa TaxID=1961234 RepID=A0ABD3BZX2_9LAMI
MGVEKVRIFRSGVWDGELYKNGSSEIINWSLRANSFDAFMKMVNEVVGVDCPKVVYRCHFMTPTENGAVERCRILSEADLHLVADTCLIPTIYVSLERKDQVANEIRSIDQITCMPAPQLTSRLTAPTIRKDFLPAVAPTISLIREHSSGHLGNEFGDSRVLRKDVDEVNGAYDSADDKTDDNTDDDVEEDPDFELDDPLVDLLYECSGWKEDEYFFPEDSDCVGDHLAEKQIVVGDNDNTILAACQSRLSIHSVPSIDFTRSDNIQREVPVARLLQSSSGYIAPGALFHYPDPGSLVQEYDNGDCELFKGATVGSKLELELKVGFYHLNKRVEYRTPRSSKTRLEVVCRYKRGGCNFVLRAYEIPGGNWKISKFVAPHTCKIDLNVCGARQVPSKVIAAFFAPKLVLEGRLFRPKEIIFNIEKKYGINITYEKALKTYHKAYSFIYGEHSKSWQLMPGYFHLLTKENPGTYTNFQTDDHDMFKYSFFALHASIKGFNEYCRPVIVVDGTFLKGKSKGVLFVAVTKDGNEQVFPLAFGLADKEKDESWVWFMQQLRNAFSCRENLVIVSDRHQSIKNAVQQVFGSEAVHAICAFHVRQNIKHYKKNVVSLYHQAAYTYSPEMFIKLMTHLKKLNAKAHEDLIQAGPERWARSQCPVRRYNFMTSNSAESLNGRLSWARKLPVCSLFEAIRHLLQDWFVVRRDEAVNNEIEVSSECNKRLVESGEVAAKMEVERLGGQIYHLKDGSHNYVVDLEKRTCTCNVFQVDLLPCSHAIKAISEDNQSLYSYVHAYYKTDTLRKLWSPIIMPVAHPNEWDLPEEISSSIVKPPIVTRGPGRPRFHRVSSTGLASRKRKLASCSRCHGTGHNSATCTVDFSLCESSSNVPVTQAPSGRAKRRCGVCKEHGHTRRKCPDLELTL